MHKKYPMHSATILLIFQIFFLSAILLVEKSFCFCLSILLVGNAEFLYLLNKFNFLK